MNPFRSLGEYERFIYTLQQRYPTIDRSTLRVARRGRGVAILTGEQHLARGYRLTVSEILTWDQCPVVIQRYSYEIWLGSDKLYWYDPQPHPDDPALADRYPHHRHIEPDIKHHRVPAPGLHFDRSNLPLLIEEIEGLDQQPTARYGIINT